jgi:hypothetical protein
MSLKILYIFIMQAEPIAFTGLSNAIYHTKDFK